MGILGQRAIGAGVLLIGVTVRVTRSPLFDLPYHTRTPLMAGISSTLVGAGLLVLKGNRL